MSRHEMKHHKLFVTLLTLLSVGAAKILRNNALITKMVSNFHQNNDESDTDKEPHSVLYRMQNVLCKNFPTIPCDVIAQDKTLKKLIEKSIQQINNKKLSLEKTTPFPGYLTLFPTINNEDLSNFLQMNDNIDKTYNQKRTESDKAKEKRVHEKRKKIKNKSKRTSVFNRKKLRKFYPHKVKYRDKVTRNMKDDFGDNSAEKLSMSVEIPDMTLTRKHQHFNYRVEPDNPPVWRIDYMKHGEPSLNTFNYGADSFNEKIVKTGPNVIVETRHPRKDVMHPDVYIKNNFVRKSNDVNSDDT